MAKLGAAGSILAGRFQLVAQVASGGMGTVHRALDMARQRSVAIKLLTDVSSSEAAERFRREASVLSELRHPGIVEFVDAGMLDGGAMYLAMQWLEGMDLGQKLLLGPIGCAGSVRLVRAVAEALSAAHARGILHRDVKPQNVFLREGDVTRPVLLDFGIATLVGLSTGITRTGLTIGTPGFMAPEQARGERSLDSRVDVYGLGCLLFQCITGTPPFVGPTPVAIVAEVLLSTAPRLRSRVPDVPAALDELVAAMLAKDVAQRPRDGHEVAERLRALESTLFLPDRAGPGAVSGEERRMVALVAVGIPGHEATTKARGTVPLRGMFIPQLAAQHRGELNLVAGGSSFIVFHSDESITEAGARAAAAALAIVHTDPTLAVSLVVGPSLLRGRLDGVIVERAASMATAPGLVIADATARGVLLERFVFAQREGGYRLVSGRLADEPARHTPFVGRDREVRALVEIFEAVVEDSASRAALVVAAAGLGKSRLLRELYVRLEQRLPTPAVIDARAEPMRKDAPLALLGQLVRRGLTVVDGAQPEEQALLLRCAIESLVPAGDLDRVTAFLAVAAGVAPPLGAPSIELAAAMRDPQLLEDQIGRAFCAVLVGLASRSGSVAIVVDDAQWADAVSARILGRAFKWLRASPLCLFAFSRPELDERLPQALRDGPLERIQLGGLPRRAAEKLVRESLGAAGTEQLVTRIVEQAEGSPLFLQELVGFASEQRMDRAPTGVLASLEARLLRLEPTARKILRAASVFGETFWNGGIAALLGEDSAEVKTLNDWLVFLVERDILVLRRTTRFPRETELSFRHALLRDVAYTMLTPEDRARGHKLAARWLETVGEREPAVLAAHFDAAGESAAAAASWAHAARLAYDRNDAAQAVLCAEGALLRGIGGAARAEALVVLANSLAWAGQVERAEQRGHEAVASSVVGSQGWVEAVSALLRILGRRDEPSAIELIRRLVEAVREDRSLRPVPESFSALVPSALRRGQRELAEDVIQVLGDAALAHAPGDPGVRANILRSRSWQAMFDWDYAACLAYDAEALACFRAAGDLRHACTSIFDLGFDCMMLGAYEQAEERFRDALLEAVRLGLDALESMIEHNLSFTLHRLGRSEEALAMQRKSIDAAVRRKDRVGEAHARHYLAIMLMESGSLELAEAELERSLSFAEALSVRWDTLARLALFALDHGNVGLARLRAAEAAHGAREVKNAEEGDMVIRLALIAVCQAEGDQEGARREIEEAKLKLLAAAARIPDPDQRRSFLTRVPEHARILELAAQPAAHG